MMRHTIYKLSNVISRNWFVFWNRYRFKRFGNRSRVLKPISVVGVENITIGDNVIVHEGSWIAATPLTGSRASLVIGNGARIGHYNHIYATQSITIEDNVLTADKVYISDNQHGYEDVNLPIVKQAIRQCNPVVIGEDSWLGENVCVIGACIGKHCVIGANAVVTHDIPDYSVAVGIPAKVIKQYDFKENAWVNMPSLFQEE